MVERENEILINVPSHDEIKKVIFDMNLLKVPSPYGLRMLFLKHFWPTVGSQVISVVQRFFWDDWMLTKNRR